MTLKSVKEYAAAIRERYQNEDKVEKGKILDEFVKVTGYHRKAATRLLCKVPGVAQGHLGRPSRYRDIVSPLRTIWEASDRLCSRRLQPFIPEMITVLRRKNELPINAETEAKLRMLSASTIDRMLQPYRNKGGRKSPGTTQSGDLLKNLIPIRTFADWKENKAGFMEIDLVAHCGESTSGFYLNTLSAVDIASGWFECAPVWGKGQERVGAAVHRIKQQVPFDLLGIDSDNGSEFINQSLYSYCQKKKITFTRSRAYKKNDNCHVEQKNGNVIRRVVGYERYSSKGAYQNLESLYYTLRLYLNFFQPTMKLLSKSRHGAKVHKVYDQAQTPYRRLLKQGVLTSQKQAELASIYNGLNPILLLTHIKLNLEHLWKLSDHSIVSVTPILKQ
jgi:hypothetical protein